MDFPSRLYPLRAGTPSSLKTIRGKVARKLEEPRGGKREFTGETNHVAMNKRNKSGGRNLNGATDWQRLGASAPAVSRRIAPPLTPGPSAASWARGEVGQFMTLTPGETRFPAMQHNPGIVNVDPRRWRRPRNENYSLHLRDFRRYEYECEGAVADTGDSRELRTADGKADLFAPAPRMTDGMR